MRSPPSLSLLFQAHATAAEGLSQHGSSAGQGCSHGQQSGEDEQTMDTEGRTEQIRPGQERETLSVRDVPATFLQVKGATLHSAKGGGLAQPQLSRGACPHSPSSVIPGRPGGDTGSPPKCRAQQHHLHMPPLCGHPSTHGNPTTAIPSHQGRRLNPPGKVAPTHPTPALSIQP